MAECQPTTPCPRCAELLAIIDQVRAAVATDATARRRGRQPKEHHTVLGRLLQGAAEAKGMSFPEVEVAIGYTKGYLNRVCTGEFNLTRRAAIALGTVLGVDLSEFVTTSGKTKPPAAPTPPELPLALATRIAADVGASQAQAIADAVMEAGR